MTLLAHNGRSERHFERDGVMRSIRIATLCVLVVFAFVPLPVQAQGGGGGANNLLARVEALEAALASEAAARAAVDGTLQTQIDKLKGNITAADLEGTYNFYFLATALDPGPGATNVITSYVITGTVTLAADGTSHLDATAAGRSLTEQAPSANWVGAGFSGIPFAGDSSWSYSNGIVTVTDAGGDTNVFTVAAGGQVMVGVQGGPPGNNQIIMVVTRQP